MDLGKDVSRRAKTQFGLDREGLVFASAYTFAKVMADNPNLARRFAERLLGIKIGALEFFEVEMDIPAALRKSVRMDAILAGAERSSRSRCKASETAVSSAGYDTIRR